MILKGQRVGAMIGAANRDPLVFNNPAHFDIFHENNQKHLSFGFGKHFCSGALLARMEAQIAVSEFFRKYPLAALSEKSPAWIQNPVFRGLTSLPIHLNPAG